MPELKMTFDELKMDRGRIELELKLNAQADLAGSGANCDSMGGGG